MIKQAFATILISGFSLVALATDLPIAPVNLENLNTVMVPKKSSSIELEKLNHQQNIKSKEMGQQKFSKPRQMSLGTANGGGGGGVFVNGHFQTLASLGLKFNDEEPEFDEVTLGQANFILDLIEQIKIMEGKRNTLLRAIFGPERKYVNLAVIDPALFAKLQAEYKPYTDQYPGKFGLAAVTNGKTTYLLPNFSKLTWRDKALLLIHEAIYSLSWNYQANTPGVELKDVLRLDIALYSYLWDNNDRPRGAWKTAYAFYKLGIPDFSPQRVEIAAELYELAGSHSPFGYATLNLDTVLTGNEPYIVNAASVVGPTVYEVVNGLNVVRGPNGVSSNFLNLPAYEVSLVANPANHLKSCFGGNVFGLMCLVEK